MALYNVKNSTGGTVELTTDGGSLVSVIAGSSATVALSDSQYSNAIGIFGISNVNKVIANPTFKYSISAFAPVATPTDVVIIQGSATKTINILKIRVSGGATAAAAMVATVVRRLATGGTIGSAVLTPVVAAKTDIVNDAAATAVVSTVGTANYTTVQTANGVLENFRLAMPALATGGGDSNAVKLEYGTANDQPLKLRGVGDYLAINFGGTAVPGGGVVDFVIESMEDNS